MRAFLQSDGNLKLIPNKSSQRLIGKMQKLDMCDAAIEAAILTQFLSPKYGVTSPATEGALTSATLLTDGLTVWGDMNYQVQSMMDTLKNGESVVMQRGRPH